MNGSSLITPDGQKHVAYAVITLDAILEAVPLPLRTTSQKAELSFTGLFMCPKGNELPYTLTPNMPSSSHMHILSSGKSEGFLRPREPP